MAPQDVSGVTDILKAAACAAGDNSLIHQQLSVMNLVFQRKRNLAVQRYLRAFFHIVQDIHQVLIQFFNRIRVAGMEGHGDHRTDLVQLYHHHSVVISHSSGIQLFIIPASAVNFIIFLNRVICFPDG